jgi:hypothetical protein
MMATHVPPQISDQNVHDAPGLYLDSGEFIPASSVNRMRSDSASRVERELARMHLEQAHMAGAMIVLPDGSFTSLDGRIKYPKSDETALKALHERTLVAAREMDAAIDPAAWQWLMEEPERQVPPAGLDADELRQRRMSWNGLTVAAAIVLGIAVGVLLLHAAANAGWLK